MSMQSNVNHRRNVCILMRSNSLIYEKICNLKSLNIHHQLVNLLVFYFYFSLDLQSLRLSILKDTTTFCSVIKFCQLCVETLIFLVIRYVVAFFLFFRMNHNIHVRRWHLIWYHLVRQFFYWLLSFVKQHMSCYNLLNCQEMCQSSNLSVIYGANYCPMENNVL